MSARATPSEPVGLGESSSLTMQPRMAAFGAISSSECPWGEGRESHQKLTPALGTNRQTLSPSARRRSAAISRAQLLAGPRQREPFHTGKVRFAALHGAAAKSPH
jgi:hypothetical protein